jgi:hypothetical protein
MKNLIGIYTSPRAHWVGDGFPVRTLFSYDNLGKHISPFLLLDHAGPAEFTPTTERRGVGQHPHRGFETVTIVYKGEVEHSDSTGSGGKIGPGDVQWMTAASGILHEEFHSHEFRQKRRHRWKWCSCGSTCRPKTKWPTPATRRSWMAISRACPEKQRRQPALDRRRVRGPHRPGAHLHPDRRLGHAPQWRQVADLTIPRRAQRRAGGAARHGSGQWPGAGARRAIGAVRPQWRSLSLKPTATPPCCCSAASRLTSPSWVTARS